MSFFASPWSTMSRRYNGESMPNTTDTTTNTIVIATSPPYGLKLDDIRFSVSGRSFLGRAAASPSMRAIASYDEATWVAIGATYRSYRTYKTYTDLRANPPRLIKLRKVYAWLPRRHLGKLVH